MITSLRLLKVTALAVAAAFLLFTWGSQGPTPAEAVLGDADGDFVLDLAEVITGSDPNDPASTPEDRGADFVLGTRLCSDGLDNDRDGLTDDADSGCLDSDGDIVSDQMETIVGSDPNNTSSFPEDSRFDTVLENIGFGFIVTCADGVDNDADGLTDADDPGCEVIRNDADDFDDITEKRFGSDPANSNSVPEHEIPNPGSCSDGVDNDLDGATDGADEACQPVLNDEFANATVIPALPYADSRKITSATRDPSDPRPSCFFEQSATVWYRFTPAADGVLAADTAGSDFDAVVSVWKQEGSRLTEVACAASFGIGRVLGTRAAFRVEAGETYYFLVGGFIFPDQPANLSFHLQAGNPPANDDFASAIDIAGLPFSHALNTLDATTEFGEPSCSFDRPTATVWYRFVASEDTLLVADATSSEFTAIIGVWTPSVFGLAEVACSTSVIGPFSSRLAFQATAGQTYYLQVGGFPFVFGAGGSLTFTLQVGVPPANDNFAGATTVGSLPFTDSVDALAATTELLEPRPSCSFGYDVTNTIWYRYAPPADTYLKGDTRGSGFFGATTIGVYTGGSLEDLTEVACAQPYFPEDRFAFRALAGQTYYFQAGQISFGGFGRFPTAGSAGFVPPGPPPNTSELVFNLDSFVVPPCAPQDFTVDDPVGDQITFFFGPPPEDAEPALDITSVSGGADARNFCLRVQFAQPIPEPDPSFARFAFAQIDFDTDENPDTGYESGLEYNCPGGPELGVELSVYFSIPSGILVPLYPFFGRVGLSPAGFPPPTEEQPTGFALFAERSFQLILPLEALGGDDAFRFAMSVNSSDGFDCAPSGGAIVSPEPAQLGDVNCDGQVNSIDSTLILQLFAGLLTESLPCQYAGDVNQNGGVGPIDALLILQYNSGALTAFPTG